MTMLDSRSAVAVWGLGREGRAALAFLARRHPDIGLTVLNDTPLGAEATEALGATPLITGPAVGDAVRSGRFDLIIKSPGISPYRQEVVDAKARGVRFSSVTNLWFEDGAAARTIAVTGTKGKSTTSGLLHHMLRAAGVDACLIGNGGVPALDQAAACDCAVLELSSYQIADLEHGPDYAVFTNLHREHMPWHGSEARYFGDKLRLASLNPATVVVANHADDRLRAAFTGRPGVRWFNDADGFRAADGRLYRGKDSLDVSGLRLKGDHNLGNLAAACTVLDLLGVDAIQALAALADFQQLPHRMQEFVVEPGVVCVDDSIATIPEATVAALKAHPDRDTVLVVGGAERGQDYGVLYDFLPKSRVKTLVLLPVTGERIAEELSRRAVSYEVLATASLAQAVELAMARANPGDLLLLSPAAPSFGQFANFEERGDAFQALCRRLARPAGATGPPASIGRGKAKALRPAP